MNALQKADCGDNLGVGRTSPLNEDYNLTGHKVADCSRGRVEDCAEILHALNNVLASVLLNAQVMEWKLPSYSRSKRYLHEIERNAQRGGELVKRLLGRLEVGCPAALSDGRPGSGAKRLAAAEGAVAADDPGPAICADKLRSEAAAPLSTVLLSTLKDAPHTMV